MKDWLKHQAVPVIALLLSLFLLFSSNITEQTILKQQVQYVERLAESTATDLNTTKIDVTDLQRKTAVGDQVMIKLTDSTDRLATTVDNLVKVVEDIARIDERVKNLEKQQEQGGG